MTALTNYQLPSIFPNGFATGVEIQGLPILGTYPRNVYWVDSTNGTASNANPGTRLQPVATLAQALVLSSAANSRSTGQTSRDIIMLCPGHSETLTASLAINVAGLNIIGLGGVADAPTFTFSSAASAGSTINITGANVDISNIKVVDGKGLTVAVTVAAINVSLNGIFVLDGVGSFVTGISVIGGGSNLANQARILGCTIRGAGATNGILLGEVDDQCVVTGNRLLGSFSTAAIQNPTGKVLTALMIESNVIQNTHATGIGINLVSACVGECTRNLVQVTVAGSEAVIPSTMVSIANMGQNSTSSNQYTIPLGNDASSVVAVSAIKALPQTTTATVATISGGMVAIEFLAAEVTTVIQSGANNTKFTFTDTAGTTATDLCAVSDIASAGVGSFLYPQGDAAATVLQIAARGTTSVIFSGTLSGPMNMGPGTLVSSCSASKTGNVKYHIRYRPLQPGAKIILS